MNAGESLSGERTLSSFKLQTCKFRFARKRKIFNFTNSNVESFDVEDVRCDVAGRKSSENSIRMNDKLSCIVGNLKQRKTLRNIGRKKFKYFYVHSSFDFHFQTAIIISEKF